MINERMVKAYCADDIQKIENYQLAINDKTQTWICHHKAEVLPCGRYSVKELTKFGLYYDRPASELIFLTKAAHTQLHFKSVLHTEEWKNKAVVGKKFWNNGTISIRARECPNGYKSGRLYYKRKS